ncbi:MAG: YXWGXW repeat-containing protein [Candidatus Acidiferrales bacterium]
MMRKARFLKWFLMAFLALAIPASSHAQVAVGISVHIGPPPLRVYAQPICPGPGYLWTPGYWAYGDAGYYWVPGAWVMAPHPGLLWTPGYWGWAGGAYIWHGGYWGPHVGFYGGINYGFGYGGVGFAGGEWRGGTFFYNRAVLHVGVNIHNTYNRTVIVHNNSHVAFNGGEGGIHAEPTRAEMAAAHEQHFDATRAQMNHEHSASMNRGGQMRANREGRENFNRPNNANRNNANRNQNRQMKEQRPAHNPKPPKNNHPNKDNHKPGGDHPGR